MPIHDSLIMVNPSRSSQTVRNESLENSWRWWGGLIAIFAIALAIRLTHIATSADTPTVRQPIGDAAGYLAWAERIAAGEWLGSKSFYQAPLYPYVIGVWYALGFDSVAAVRALQSFFGALAAAILAIAARKMFSPSVGLIAGLMLALYAPAIYFDGIIQKASLDGLLVCAVVACVALVTEQLNAGRTFALGVMVSLLCLTRENAMAWHLVLFAWVGLRCFGMRHTGTLIARTAHGPQTSACATSSTDAKFANRAQGAPSMLRPAAASSLAWLAYLLGASVVLLPVGLRNAYVQGEFLLTTSQAGPNFYIGNNANADGRYQPLVRGHETPVFEQADAKRLAERAEGRSLTPREVSHYWMRRTWSDIAADPMRWLKLCGYKLLLVWNRYEIADAESIVIHRRSSTVLDALACVWHFGVLAPLAMLGIWLTWNDRRKLAVFYALILIMTFAVAAFFVLARYRYPLVPLLIPFAVAGLVELWKHRKKPGRVTSAVLLALVAAIVINWPIQDEARLDALAEMNTGVALAQSGEIEAAGEFFARAVLGHPSSAEANYNLALALAIQGRFAEAIPYYDRAIQVQQDLPGVHFNLAGALEQTGQREAALQHYEIAAAQDPADSEARAAIRRLSP